MSPSSWPHRPPEVAYFHDEHGIAFAAEIVRTHEWSAALNVLPDPLVADIRIAFVEVTRQGLNVPRWLVVMPPNTERAVSAVQAAARRAWPYSPSYRTPAAPPEDYVVAGFQALCPPHPPCEPGIEARVSLGAFLRERPGVLGLLGDQGRDGFDRLVQVAWPTPGAFADAILADRIRDAGAGSVVELAHFLEGASSSGEVSEWAALEEERMALLARLRPLRYFTDVRDFDRATEEALDWVARYRRAYATHYRRVMRAVRDVLHDLTGAELAARTLASMNSGGRAIGADAVQRLDAALSTLRALPAEVDAEGPRTAGIPLGHFPPECSEAYVAAAAVQAALDVQRRRSSSSPARTQA